MNILKKKVKLVQSANMLIVLIVRNEGEKPEECFLFKREGFTKNKKSNISVKHNSFHITYDELLTYIISHAFNVESTYIESINYTQVVSKIEITNSFIENRTSITYHPRRDKNQYQSGIVLLKENFKLDLTTQIRYVVEPLTTVTFSFYLKQEDKYEMVSRFKLAKNWFKTKFRAIKSKLINNK
jgi:hypothetical protein